MVQKLNLLPVEARQQAMAQAGNNTFLLRSEDVFLDMLTDSGVNAAGDQAVASMMVADDSYAGSATYYRLEKDRRAVWHAVFSSRASRPRLRKHTRKRFLSSLGTSFL